MKNPFPWIVGVNLALQVIGFLWANTYIFSFLLFAICLNLLIAIILAIRGKSELALAFALAPFVVVLIGLGICATMI